MSQKSFKPRLQSQTEEFPNRKSNQIPVKANRNKLRDQKAQADNYSKTDSLSLGRSIQNILSLDYC